MKLLIKILKSLLLTFLILLLSAYLLFPLLAPQVVKFYLPSDWQLKSFDIGYPSLSQINLNHVEIDWAGNQLILDKGSWDFNKGQISLTQLILKLNSIKQLANRSDQTTARLNPMDKPIIIDDHLLAAFAPLAIIHQLSIKNLNIEQLMMQGSFVTEIFSLAKAQASGQGILFNGQQVESLHWQHLLLNIEPKVVDLSAQLSFNQSPATTQSVALKPIQLAIALRQVKPLWFELKTNISSTDHWQLQHQQQQINVQQPQLSLIVDAQLNKALDLFHQNEPLPQQNKLSMMIASPISLQLKRWNAEFKFNRLLLKSGLDKTKPIASLLLTDGLWRNQWQPSNTMKSPIEGQLTSKKFEYQQFELDQPKRTITANLTSQYQLFIGNNKDLKSNGKIILSDMSGEYQGQVISGKTQLNWNDVNVALNQGRLKLTQDFSQESAKLIGFDLIDARLSSELGHDSWQGQLQLKLDEQKIPAHFIYHLKQQMLELTLQSNSILNPLVNRMAARYITDKTLQPKLIDGQINHQAHLLIDLKRSQQQPEAIKVTSQLQLKNGIIEFSGHRFQGIEIKEQLKQLQPIKATSELSVEQIQLASNLQLSHLKAHLQLDQGKGLLTVRGLEARIFSGNLISQLIKIKDNRLLASQLYIEHLDLKPLLDFIAVDGLTISGKVDLSLPIKTVNGQIVITDGAFHTLKPGIIQYQMAEMGQAGGINIASQALQNFHYQKISGTIDYNEQGEYRIALHLLGKNPDLYDGYPIDFKLVLNGQLSGVFKSLFLTGDFEQAILQQLKAPPQGLE